MTIYTIVMKNENMTVILDDEEKTGIKLDRELVTSIVDCLPQADFQDVAIVLATIEKARIDATPRGNIKKRLEKIDNDSLKDSVINLLREYDSQTLCEIIEDLKYYQIEEILQSDTPNLLIRYYL